MESLPRGQSTSFPDQWYRWRSGAVLQEDEVHLPFSLPFGNESVGLKRSVCFGTLAETSNSGKRWYQAKAIKGDGQQASY
jgi:hypothetical protein